MLPIFRVNHHAGGAWTAGVHSHLTALARNTLEYEFFAAFFPGVAGRLDTMEMYPMSTRMRAAVFAAGLVASIASLLPAAAEAHGASTSRSCLTSSARAALARVEARFGPMQIVSTCRPGATIRGTGKRSLHASGNAIDFNAGSRKGAVLKWLIASHGGGVMTYRGMSHIHIDVGPRFVSLGSGGTRVASRRGSRKAVASLRRSAPAAQSAALTHAD